MATFNPMILTDFYKQSHAPMYAPGTEQVYSTWTWRTSRMENIDAVVAYHFQGFIKEFLIDYFNQNFFSVRKSTVVDGYHRLLKNSVGASPDNAARAEALWDLGYLPIAIHTVPEGTILPIRTPTAAFWNTNKEFFWLTNYIESLMSAEIWQPMTVATLAFGFRKLLTSWMKRTSGDPAAVMFQGHDFSFRGMAGCHAAAKAGAGHLLSFYGTDTFPAISYLEQYYNANSDKTLIGTSIPASEHSVAESYGDINECEYFRHIIEDVYPNGFVSIVSDTWDFWKVISETVPALKATILKRDGRLVIRPDSGDPVKIVCGDPGASEECVRKGAIECLWDTFGGKISNGFKQLDPHIGLIYGDAITWTRANTICEKLAEKGFSSTNVVFGIGSYTYQYNTRDTFGGAVKSSMAVIDGKEVPMFKCPKTDNGVKKSQKGCSVVFQNGTYQDGFTLAEACAHPDNMLQEVFRDGKLIREVSLEEIRERLNTALKAQTL